MDVPVFRVELKSVEETKISDIFLPHIYPKISEKQKEAIELAVKNGYYEYPRKIDVKNLANISGLAFSTFQAHLRKAEQKIERDKVYDILMTQPKQYQATLYSVVIVCEKKHKRVMTGEVYEQYRNECREGYYTDGLTRP